MGFELSYNGLIPQQRFPNPSQTKEKTTKMHERKNPYGPTFQPFWWTSYVLNKEAFSFGIFHSF